MEEFGPSSFPDDRPLDAKIAFHIFGYRWNRDSAFDPAGGRNARVNESGEPLSDPWWWLPRYSTDMSAAWEIIRLLRTQGPSARMDFTAALLKITSQRLHDDPSIGFRSLFVFAEPHEICSAALLCPGHRVWRSHR